MRNSLNISTIGVPRTFPAPDKYGRRIIKFPRLLGGRYCEQAGITQSMLHNTVCRVKFFIALNRWAKKDTSLNTGFGSIFHGAHDVIYSNGGGFTEKMIEKVVDDYITAHAVDCLGAMDEQRTELERAKAYAVLKEYCEYYKADFKTKLFTEVEGLHAYNFKGYKLRCKMDGAFTQRKSGTRWVFEHKTKSYIDEGRLYYQLALDFQNLFYKLIKEAETGEQYEGTLYNIIRNPQLRQGKSESLKAFMNRIRADIKKQPKHYFKRIEALYSRRDSKIFADQLTMKLEDTVELLEHPRIYRNEFACSGFTWPCNYLIGCAADDLKTYEQREHLYPELMENAG